MKFKNGTEIKEGDRCVGLDHFGGPCSGVAIKGIPAKAQPDFVFKNDSHGHVQSSLSLNTFLREDEKNWTAPMPSVQPFAKPAISATPPLSTAK
jgi:hypothetical protein